MLYGARFVRFELLLPVCSMARQVSKWNRACDKPLHRLVSYIHWTNDHSLESFVGYDPALCHPMLFSDADFAGDITHAKSTSEAYLAIVGPNTFAPITAACKKHTCVSHSSTESETVASEQDIRTEGLQALTFWEYVVGLLSDTHGSNKVVETHATPNNLELNPYSPALTPGKYFAYTRKSATKITNLIVAEDNEAVIKIIKKARSMALRHLPWTHRIDVHWLFEVWSSPQVCMRYCNTKQQIADLMTKALNSRDICYHLLDIAQIRPGLTSERAETRPVSVAEALPLAAVECPTCHFNTSTSKECLCHW